MSPTLSELLISLFPSLLQNDMCLTYVIECVDCRTQRAIQENLHILRLRLQIVFSQPGGKGENITQSEICIFKRETVFIFQCILATQKTSKKTCESRIHLRTKKKQFQCCGVLLKRKNIYQRPLILHKKQRWQSNLFVTTTPDIWAGRMCRRQISSRHKVWPAKLEARCGSMCRSWNPMGSRQVFDKFMGLIRQNGVIRVVAN